MITWGKAVNNPLKQKENYEYLQKEAISNKRGGFLLIRDNHAH